MRLTPVCVAALVLLAAGCGDGTVAGDSTVADPYDGPMYVEPDHSDRASVLERSGAAGLALECDHAPGAGGGGNYDTGPETVGSDATEGLEDWLEDSGVVAPTAGFVVERNEGDRVLFSYDVGYETKFAAIASGDMKGEGGTGWGVEAWAQCDAAELPESVTDEWGTQVWEKDGRRVPVSRIQSHDGPEHCDWQDIVFLDLGEYPDGAQYLRDVENEFTGQGLVVTSFADGVSLPDDARDTGYEYGDRHLWLAADESAAYVVSIENPDDVERWPAAKDYIHCA